MRPLRPAIAAVVAEGTLLAGVGPAAASSSPAPTDWLGIVNAYRTTAALAPVGGNGDWAAGGVAHSRYMVVNGVVTHDEDPGNPDRAANAGLAAGTRPATFAPGVKVARDQMATFVSRATARLAARGFASPPAR